MNDAEIALELKRQSWEDAPDRLAPTEELLEMINENRTAHNLIVSNNFPELSKSIGGFKDGELVVISGWSGHGKTLFMQTLINDFAMQGIKSSVFSFEITLEEFFDRFGSAVPLLYASREERANDMKWLFDKIVEGIERFDSRVVFIDHLHYIISMASGVSKSDQIGESMRALKLFAKNNGVKIFLIAHTTKPKVTSEDTLGMGSVRDSSFIEQESDTVLYVWRADDHPSGGFLKIAKDRKRGTYNKTIKLLKVGTYLFEANNVRM